MHYVLLLFFVFEYVRPGSYVRALNILHLNSIIPFVLVLGSVFSGRAAAAFRERNVHLVFALLGLIGVSVLTADVTLYSYNVFTAVLGYAVIAVVLRTLLDDFSKVRGVLNTLIMVHIVVAALTPEMILDPAVRHYVASGAFLGDGNDFALSVNVVLPFCLFLALTTRRTFSRLFYLIAALFLVFCIVATQSRGGTVALACVGAYYWLKSDRKLVAGVFVALAVVLVFVLAPESYFGRMNQMNTTEGSAKGRILAWQASMRMAADHPVLGVGAGHFGVKYGVDYRPPGGEQVPWQTAHSIYFLALGELGFPGLLLLLATIGTNLLANRRLGRLVRERGGPSATHDLRLLACLSASQIAFASGGAFLSVLYYPHLYVLAGLQAAARHLIAARSEAAESERTA